jgi:hypothetical protein
MIATPRAGRLTVADRLSLRFLFLWAGFSIGVAFLATPVKFLAPSLSLPVALDVGRHTFSVYNRVELALLFGLIALAVGSAQRRSRILALSVPGVIVVVQALWLIPALDARVAALLAGRQPPASDLHAIYIGIESLKVFWLLYAGLGDLLPHRPTSRIIPSKWKD